MKLILLSVISWPTTPDIQMEEGVDLQQKLELGHPQELRNNLSLYTEKEIK
jgi:hypothetical protein